MQVMHELCSLLTFNVLNLTRNSLANLVHSTCRGSDFQYRERRLISIYIDGTAFHIHRYRYSIFIVIKTNHGDNACDQDLDEVNWTTFQPYITHKHILIISGLNVLKIKPFRDNE